MDAPHVEETCIVCGERLEYSFSKTFADFDLGRVDYAKCPECGFMASVTHMRMSFGEWLSLNGSYHSFHGGEEAPDDPRWVRRLRLQSRLIAELAEKGVLSVKRPWLDYGCGDGKLCDMLAGRGLEALKYDRYMTAFPGLIDERQLEAGRPYDLVISTAVFEHLLRREDLDFIPGLLSDKGALALHTWAAATVPEDPSWFYLLPVHCSFFSNMSMSILFRDWGFQCSLYHPEARMWFWLREDAELELEGFVFEHGFVDYWP